MKSIFEAFEEQPANELLVVLSLYVMRIFSITRNHFESRFRKRGASSEEVAVAEWDGRAHDRWDWADFPRLAPALRLYEYCTSAYMAYALARAALSSQLGQLIAYLEPALQPHCYLLGRFTMHEEIDGYASIALSFLHLLWRALQFRLERAYDFSAYTFLLITDHDLAKFIRRLGYSNDGAGRHRRKWAGRHFESSAGYDGGDHDQDLDTGPRLIDETNSSRCPHDRELLFKQTLCYKVERRAGISYRLRPHRTLEARRQLRRQAALTVVWLAGLIASSMSAVLIVVLAKLLDGRHYAHKYPNCSPPALAPSSGARFEASLHKALAFAADLTESITLWGESTLAIFVGWAAVYLLNYDNLLYWNHIDRRLRLLLLQTRVDQAAGGGSTTLEARFVARAAAAGAGRRGARLLSARRRANLQANGGPARQAAGAHERLVHELQAQIYDFFRQIGATDLLISDLITASIVIWLLDFAFFGHFIARGYRAKPDLLAMIISIELVSYAVITAGSLSLLSLHQNCLKSYVTICSLMAHDQSKHKRGFLKLMEFYTVKKRSAYTLFQQYPYTKSTYLSIFSWSLSCFFILDNMFSS